MGIQKKLGHSYHGAGGMVKRSVIKVASSGCFVLGVLPLLLLASCGIFSPRSSETPENFGRVDPLNFSAIMAGTGHNFTQLSLSSYENLFVDGLLYEDFNSGSSSKASLIPKLQSIETQYANIKVQWTTGQIWTSADNDTMKLSGLKYYIFTDSTSGVPADSGSSNFTIVNNQDWLICQWADVPNRLPTTGKSFFAP
jgi:hypothetical protein